MSLHQIFLRQNRLIISDGKNEIAYSLEEVQSLIEALQQGVIHLAEQEKQTQEHIAPLQEKLQLAQERWVPVGSDEHLQTTLQLSIEGDWNTGIQSLILASPIRLI